MARIEALLAVDRALPVERADLLDCEEAFEPVGLVDRSFLECGEVRAC